MIHDYFSPDVIYLSFHYFFAEAIVSSGKTEKSPHDQEIKFFAKVSDIALKNSH